MMILVVLAYAFALLMVLATFLPLLPTRSRFIRSGDFPRVQIMVLLVLAGVLLLLAGGLGILWGRILLSLVVVSILIQCRYILPYTRLVSPDSLRLCECPDRRRVRVMVANVLQDNRDYDRFLQEVRRVDPDLLLALETDQPWVDEIAKLAERLPHAAERPQDNYYGMVLRSRFELSEERFRVLVQDDIPSLKVTVRFPDGRPFVFYGVHPPPPPLQDTDQRDGELLIAGRQASDAGLPAILAGDLNDVGWSATTRLLRRVTDLLDPRVGRGMYPTFHAQYPPMRWPLDHIFHSPHFGLLALSVGRQFGSDHLPVICDLCLTSDDDAGHNRAPRRLGDESSMREKVGAALGRDRDAPKFLTKKLKKKD